MFGAAPFGSSPFGSGYAQDIVYQELPAHNRGAIVPELHCGEMRRVGQGAKGSLIIVKSAGKIHTDIKDKSWIV